MKIVFKMLKVYHVTGLDVTVAVQVALHLGQVSRLSLGQETVTLQFNYVARYT